MNIDDISGKLFDFPQIGAKMEEPGILTCHKEWRHLATKDTMYAVCPCAILVTYLHTVWTSRGMS